LARAVFSHNDRSAASGRPAFPAATPRGPVRLLNTVSVQTVRADTASAGRVPAAGRNSRPQRRRRPSATITALLAWPRDSLDISARRSWWFVSALDNAEETQEAGHIAVHDEDSRLSQACPGPAANATAATGSPTSTCDRSQAAPASPQPKLPELRRRCGLPSSSGRGICARRCCAQSWACHSAATRAVSPCRGVGTTGYASG